MLRTLWHVNDAATALLIAKFYELHLGEKLALPVALKRAQVWLRQATNAELSAPRSTVEPVAREPRTEQAHEITVSDEAAAYIADALMQLALEFEANHFSQIRRHYENHCVRA